MPTYLVTEYSDPRYKALRSNSDEMYLLKSLQYALKPHMKFSISNKPWTSQEKIIIRDQLHDLWDIPAMARLCGRLYRNPFAVFYLYTEMMWKDLVRGQRELFDRMKVKIPKSTPKTINGMIDRELLNGGLTDDEILIKAKELSLNPHAWVQRSIDNRRTKLREQGLLA